MKGFRTIKDLRLTNLKDVIGVPNADLEYAKTRGAEFGNKVAVSLDVFPSDIEFPDHLKQKISYDASAKLLIWDGDMSNEEYKELRELVENVPFNNAVLKLDHQSYWIRED